MVSTMSPVCIIIVPAILTIEANQSARSLHPTLARHSLYLSVFSVIRIKKQRFFVIIVDTRLALFLCQSKSKFLLTSPQAYISSLGQRACVNKHK